MKLTCQILFALLAIYGVLRTIKSDIEGVPAQAPEGFKGVAGTLLAYVIIMALWAGAGAFSEITKYFPR